MKSIRYFILIMTIFTEIHQKLTRLFGQTPEGRDEQGPRPGPKFIAAVLGWALLGLGVFGALVFVLMFWYILVFSSTCFS